MFLDKKTMLKVGLNPGLNLTIFRGTGWKLLMWNPESSGLRNPESKFHWQSRIWNPKPMAWNLDFRLQYWIPLHERIRPVLVTFITDNKITPRRQIFCQCSTHDGPFVYFCHHCWSNEHYLFQRVRRYCQTSSLLPVKPQLIRTMSGP